MAIAAEAENRPSAARLGAATGAAFFAICAATYVINAADRVIFPVLLKPIAAEYGFTLAQSGLLATIYVLGLGAGGVATGYLLDRISRKSSMIAGIVIYSVFTILTAMAAGFFDIAAYRTLTGLGEAMQNVALVIAVGTFYTRSRTLAIGLIQTALGIGSFIGPRLGAALLAASGDWRLPFYAFGVAGLVGAVAVLFVSRSFTEQQQTPAGKMAEDAHMPAALWNRNLIAMLLVGIVRSFPFLGFIGLYTTFLTTELHYPLGTAAATFSWFGLGPLFSPLAGLIGDRTNQKSFQIAGLAVMAITGFLIFNIARTPLAQSVLALIEGISGAFVYVNGYSLVQRCVRSPLIARASGYYYASTTVPAAISGYVLARLIQAFGWSFAATLLFSASLIVPIVISLFIDMSQVTGPSRDAPRQIWT